MDGISNKMVAFKTRVANDNPDIIAICETWTQDNPLDSKFYPSECLTIPGYNLYRYDNTCKQNKQKCF